jgi:hypothetical protein
MKKIGQILFSILFWRYPRGSWQYDVFCAVLILLTIFIEPGFLLTYHKNKVPIRIIISQTKPVEQVKPVKPIN